LPEAVLNREKTPASACPALKVEAKRIRARGIIPADLFKYFINEGFFDEPGIVFFEGKISLFMVLLGLAACVRNAESPTRGLNAYKARNIRVFRQFLEKSYIL
jgi:hypothetical protein